MTAEQLPCNLVVELLTDYVEGALDPVTAERVEAHLAQCPPCVTYLEQLRTTIRQVGSLPLDTLPESTVAALEAAFCGFHPLDAHWSGPSPDDTDGDIGNHRLR